MENPLIDGEEGESVNIANAQYALAIMRAHNPDLPFVLYEKAGSIMIATTDHQVLQSFSINRIRLSYVSSPEPSSFSINENRLKQLQFRKQKNCATHKKAKGW